MFVALTLAVTESESSRLNGEALRVAIGIEQLVDEVDGQFVLSTLNTDESSCLISTVYVRDKPPLSVGAFHETWMFEPDTDVVTDYGPEGLDAAKLVSSFENVP